MASRPSSESPALRQSLRKVGVSMTVCKGKAPYPVVRIQRQARRKRDG
jgi:hypothetical protein